jgi:hypothetical protein
MGKVIMRVEGSDGVAELLPDRVVVYHEGIWNIFKFGFNAKREIPLSGISEIGFRSSNIIMFGEIDFIVAGRSTQPTGLSKKAKPSAVQFNKKKQKDFEIFKEKVFQQMMQQNKKQT